MHLYLIRTFKKLFSFEIIVGSQEVAKIVHRVPHTLLPQNGDIIAIGQHQNQEVDISTILVTR